MIPEKAEKSIIEIHDTSTTTELETAVSVLG
jgi:hypothetical protein